MSAPAVNRKPITVLTIFRRFTLAHEYDAIAVRCQECTDNFIRVPKATTLESIADKCLDHWYACGG